MSVENELKKLGYKFEYAQDDGGDRTEVWINQDQGLAIRIEWMKVDGDGWRTGGPIGTSKPAVGDLQDVRHCDDSEAASVSGTRVLP
ncbi:MAG: hypothetical protein ACE15C_18315 [Phycisphaerae bacterium]